MPSARTTGSRSTSWPTIKNRFAVSSRRQAMTNSPTLNSTSGKPAYPCCMARPPIWNARPTRDIRAVTMRSIWARSERCTIADCRRLCSIEGRSDDSANIEPSVTPATPRPLRIMIAPTDRDERQPTTGAPCHQRRYRARRTHGDANRYRFIPAISSMTAQTAAVSCISRPWAVPA
jgi:hypothetical protein